MNSNAFAFILVIGFLGIMGALKEIAFHLNRIAEAIEKKEN